MRQEPTQANPAGRARRHTLEGHFRQHLTCGQITDIVITDQIIPRRNNVGKDRAQRPEWTTRDSQAAYVQEWLEPVTCRG